MTRTSDRRLVRGTGYHDAVPMGAGGMWDHALLAGFAAVVAGGVVLLVAPDAPFLDWLNRSVESALLEGAAPETTEALRAWLYGLVGSILVGFGVLGAWVARTAFRGREPWARDALMVSVGLWFVLDTGASMAYGVWANAALNVGIAVLLLAPVLALWRRFPAEGAAATGEPAGETGRAGAAARIDWEPPAPRPGWSGAADRFFGPGTTGAEYLLQAIAVAALTGGVLAVTAGAPSGPSLSAWQWVLLTVLAVDMTGGVVTNATSAAKRWYHRPGQGFRQHFGFVAVHGVHLALFAAVLDGMSWGALVLSYGSLLAAAVALLSVPLYLQRPLAMTLFAGLLLLSLALVPPASGLAWFLPLFYLKLTVSHLVREAPFRPAGVSRGDVASAE